MAAGVFGFALAGNFQAGLKGHKMTAILISTFKRYENLARWSATRISQSWQGHPPIFFSGLPHQDGGSLGFEGDSKDWMGVNLQAVIRLLNRGFTHAYLILDDHPPVGPCDSGYLNSRLPQLAHKLDAAYIGLLGYGQHRRLEGSVLGAEEDFLEHTSRGYRWKFSLHPGLWHLKDLQTLLECRREVYPEQDGSPWNFERHRDEPGDPRIDAMASRCFRVNGSAVFARSTSERRAILFEAIHRFLVDVGLFTAKRLGGKALRDAWERRWLWAFGHYAGPYPIFWSGCMRQGKPQGDFEKWLAASGSTEFLASWMAAKENCFLE